MSDNRRYFYLKLKESFYNSETMVVLESMQDGLIYSNLLMKMYLMSLKNNGILMLNDHIPHSPQTIATFTRHQIGTVERALKVFIELGLVEILTYGTYYMTDIQMLIGLSSTEGERKKRERMRLQEQNLLPQTVVDICPPIGKVDKCPPILELEKELELKTEIERELETGQTAPAPLGRYKNILLSQTELADLKAELPTKWQHYIDRLSEYMASTGKKYQSHLATIRRWAAADGKQSGMPDYSYEEGESL
ncbi:MAG: phage replisome organizer N-terminal domain-containing protein [Lachnospiraceae bacterium]|nr:phage replisome organizer N-terminal domain-containing protein [Lachnospiraceae bacterium]